MNEPETAPLLNGQHTTNNGTISSNGTCCSETFPNHHGNSSKAKAEEDAARQSVWWTMPALAIGIFLSAADQTLVVASYGKIGTEFSALNKTSWIATAYFLTMTSFQPLYGRISDLFGCKAALMFSFGLFGAGCLWCGLARSMEELIAARAFAGIGGGGMTTVVAILLSNVVPLKDRGKWQGYNNIVYATGAGLGAPLGGALADTLGWRWSFLLQVPITLIAFFNVLLTLKEQRSLDINWKSNIRNIDFMGALLLVGAISTLYIGMDRGSNNSWASPLAYGNLIASAILFPLFLLNEAKTKCYAFAPLDLIFTRPILSCLLCNFFGFFTYLSLTYSLPLYWQAVESLSATESGLRLLPGIISNVCGSLFAGWFMSRTGKYKSLTILCYSIFLAGTGIAILFTGVVSSSILGIWIGMAIYAFGNGIGGTSTLVALISNAAPEDQAVGISCLYLFRSLGSGIGISISATVIQARLRNYLYDRLNGMKDLEETIRKVRESLDYINQLPDPEVRRIVRECYEWAAQDSFFVVALFLIGAIFGAVWIRERRLGG
ncbi:hypothetical protein FQN57_005101 [Myotisia sp. PD_48]|nr:hypothetical protein FQN57_005101 [Myotisia sp. PD_48]